MSDLQTSISACGRNIVQDMTHHEEMSICSVRMTLVHVCRRTKCQKSSQKEIGFFYTHTRERYAAADPGIVHECLQDTLTSRHDHGQETHSDSLATRRRCRGALAKKYVPRLVDHTLAGRWLARLRQRAPCRVQVRRF